MNTASELVRKLDIRAKYLAVALNANPDILASIQEALPEGATLVMELPTDIRPKIILVWLTDRDDLYRVFQRLGHAITPDGAIWAVIAKKTAAKNKTASVTFDQVQAAALKTNLVDNKVVSFSDQEYGIRFVIRREKRGV